MGTVSTKLFFQGSCLQVCHRTKPGYDKTPGTFKNNPSDCCWDQMTTFLKCLQHRRTPGGCYYYYIPSARFAPTASVWATLSRHAAQGSQARCPAEGRPGAPFPWRWGWDPELTVSARRGGLPGAEQGGLQEPAGGTPPLPFGFRNSIPNQGLQPTPMRTPSSPAELAIDNYS